MSHRESPAGVALQFVHRFVGALWMCLGAMALAAATLTLLAREQAGRWVWSGLPQMQTALAGLLAGIPAAGWALAWAALAAFAAFSVFAGIGLLRLRPWARSVACTLSFVIAACAAGLVLLSIARLPAGRVTALTGVVQAAGALLGLGSVAFGLLLGSQASLRTFAGDVPRLPRTPAARCPTCGGGLDLIKTNCPKCDAVSSHPTEPKRARLVDLANGKDYNVSLRKLNRVGREMPGYEIQIDHRSVSGNHASIEYHQGRFYLHAHEDTFGTYVNQRRTRDSEIRHNDILTFGQAELRFIVDY